VKPAAAPPAPDRTEETESVTGAGAARAADVTVTADPAPAGVPPMPPPPEPALPLSEVSPELYQIEGEQGRGGIGVVMRARDRRLDRLVALKQLQRDDRVARERFEREMRITAKLQHPGVVPVHEAGRFPSGEPFYAMKLVEGRSLKELIAEKKTLEERMALLPHVLAVTETIAYAHSKGIIHRDLKPANVIVGAFGETVVIDWGLAKDLGEDLTGRQANPIGTPYRVATDGALTVVGQVIGTPAYMS
jgi:serine/threonine protein kinase